MKRRRYLRAVGAAGAVGIAGCSGGGGDGDGGDEDGEDAPVETADRGAAYHIGLAVGDLNTAAIALADYQERFRESADVDFEFDAERQSERIASAREALSTAESEGPDQEQAAQIRGLRAAADALAATSESVGELRGATDELDRVEPPIRDRNFSLASRRLSNPANRVSSVDQSVSAARESLDQLNADRMDATNLRFSDLRDGVRELDDLVGSFDTLLTGYDALVTAGETIQAARAQFRAEDYRDARDSLTDADRRVEDARSAFRSGRSNAPERLQGRFATGLCQSVRLSEAISLFDDAARTALRGGDPSRERSEAVATLRSIEDC
jgi:hypothetical protein